MAIETSALIIGWNRVIPGRESAAAEAFAATGAYFEAQKKAGKVESYEPFFLTAHGGDLNGFWLVRGTEQNLNAVRSDETFLGNLLRAQHCLDGIGVIPAYTGNAIPQVMQLWIKNAPR